MRVDVDEDDIGPAGSEAVTGGDGLFHTDGAHLGQDTARSEIVGHAAVEDHGAHNVDGRQHRDHDTGAADRFS